MRLGDNTSSSFEYIKKLRDLLDKLRFSNAMCNADHEVVQKVLTLSMSDDARATFENISNHLTGVEKSAEVTMKRMRNALDLVSQTFLRIGCDLTTSQLGYSISHQGQLEQVRISGELAKISESARADNRAVQSLTRLGFLFIPGSFVAVCLRY